MGITGELSKVGGMGGATTEQSIRSSRDFTIFPSKERARPPSTQLMSGANSILQMCPQEEYTLQNPFSFSQYNSQWNLSSSTHNHPSQQLNCKYTEMIITSRQWRNGLTMLTKGLALTCDNTVDISANNQTNPNHKLSLRFDQSLPISKATHV